MPVLENFNHLTEKCRKITEALYRVTDLMPEEEPLKWDLRERAMGIFSRIVELKNAPIHKKAKNFEEIIHSVSGIFNFLELASAASFISQLNFEVLKREYSTLVNFIEDNKEICLSSDATCPKTGREFLPAEQVLIQSPPPAIVKGHNGQNNFFSIEKMSIKNNTDNTGRRSKIITILINKKDWMSIKDIISVFNDVGPKTVQRELSAMVSQGLLKTIGEKRWRKYAIKSN